MRKTSIDAGPPQLGVRTQASLLDIHRNGLQSKARGATAFELELCREIDELRLCQPYYGSRRIWKANGGSIIIHAHRGANPRTTGLASRLMNNPD